MNFSQKLGLFILILISVLYVYISFFNKDFKLPEYSRREEKPPVYNPLEKPEPVENEEPQEGAKPKTVKIFILDKSGNLRSVNRSCDTSVEKSCFTYAIKELVAAPSPWEKSKGFTSEIPAGTKVLSIRESSGNALIDLSSDFETGGGAESTYYRVKQIIKTANANTSSPVYLYINGKQANVIGGEGIMLKQPLNERSLDE
ncbi:MAG: GerMN domain-containing protein [Candidatus Gastranaerophilales bacterium]|nr:GerMN domain-containing protein [Candidatus Gastranaerophilales bacterium]MCM1073804.1 GerMN domain-containing protein [Bacteroides sp.]